MMAQDVEMQWHVPGCNCPLGSVVCAMAPTWTNIRCAETQSPSLNRKERRAIAAINRRSERRALGRTLGGAR